ncbi:MAG: nuclear transport factor 2 family protein [Sphingomonadales bacterium]|nr:nuclear transport factor 2 family protein [Sphingomonadales bacterium]
MSSFAEAECGIRQLHARFVDAVWRQDAEAFALCFAPEGEWKIAGMHIKGRAALADACRRLLGRCTHIQLMPQPAMLEITGDSAIGRQHMIELARMQDGSSAMTIGINYDRYRLVEGAWRIAWRHWTTHYRGPVDMTGPFVAAPDFGPFPGMPGADEPTVFASRPPEG